MKSGTVPLKQLTRFAQRELARLRRGFTHFGSRYSVLRNTEIKKDFEADYEAWRDRFLYNRLHWGLWIALLFNVSVILFWVLTGIYKKLPRVEDLFVSVIVQEVLLVVCLALYKSQWGKRYPAGLFLCLSWIMTMVRQFWATFGGYNLPVFKSWTLIFLAQAVLMPVRWPLHLLSQVVLLVYYFGVNGRLSIEPLLPNELKLLPPNVKQLLYSKEDWVLFFLWFCLICDVSVYLYERLQRAELRSRLKLEAAEAKYHSIFDNAAEGIFQTTLEGRYLTVNPALAKIYGYSSPEEVIAHFNDIEHQLYVDPNRRAQFIRLMEENDELSDFESQIYRADGSIVWISEKAKAVRDVNGNTLYYEGLIEDITERKQAEEALRIFIHAVSHDLRNPVTGTLLVLKNLQSQPGNTLSISRSILERMIQSGDRQVKLINTLLEAHASEVRGIVSNCEPLELVALIQGVLADLEPLVLQYQATLTNLVPAELPRVNGDRHQLWRVFENLISNALKHNPPGVSVTVAATVETTMIRCSVEDDGIGISQQQRDRLFQLYVRGSQSQHTSGLGLGLYLCRQIITAHEGEIDVITSPEAGTIFWFTLPITHF